MSTTTRKRAEYRATLAVPHASEPTVDAHLLI
jgi:hypothetical protein